MGIDYGITYIHPLLDKDLVEFAASIPRDFFKKPLRRGLFKLGLQNDIPNELLQGNKRPYYSDDKTFAIDEDEIKNLINDCNKLTGTFANSVYNYQAVIKYLKKFNSNEVSKLNRGIVKKLKFIVNEAKFLNKYFQ